MFGKVFVERVIGHVRLYDHLAALTQIFNVTQELKKMLTGAELRKMADRVLGTGHK